MAHISLAPHYGPRIDEVEDFPTLEALKAYMAMVSDTEVTELPAHQVEEASKLYEPLGLSGTYMVTGIEGKYYDGYVPGKDLTEAGWVDAPENDKPWPLEVTPNMSGYDIMVAVAASEANGYPYINHVWFEGLDIDTEARTLKFSMGS